MWVKICGINDVTTAAAVAACGPDAIGLNFFAGSPRGVPLDVARQIVASLPAAIEPVGVFVNHSAVDVLRICRECRLGTAQLHGDEPPALLAELRAHRDDLKLIRAHRLGNEGLAPLASYLEECQRLEVDLRACLIDARVAGHYGGSGQSPPWDILTRDYRRDTWPNLILAGGLHPENVTAGIAAVHPWGVDVASGVESAPGQKDLRQVAAFIERAREKS